MNGKPIVAENESLLNSVVSLQSKEYRYKGQLELEHSITTNSSSPGQDVWRRKPNHLLSGVRKLVP